jgi:hypothetical protein
MRLSKDELKSLIKECLVEILTEPTVNESRQPARSARAPACSASERTLSQFKLDKSSRKDRRSLKMRSRALPVIPYCRVSLLILRRG